MNPTTEGVAIEIWFDRDEVADLKHIVPIRIEPWRLVPVVSNAVAQMVWKSITMPAIELLVHGFE